VNLKPSEVGQLLWDMWSFSVQTLNWKGIKVGTMDLAQIHRIASFHSFCPKASIGFQVPFGKVSMKSFEMRNLTELRASAT
jgi:hypothetical protein